MKPERVFKIAKTLLVIAAIAIIALIFQKEESIARHVSCAILIALGAAEGLVIYFAEKWL